MSEPLTITSRFGSRTRWALWGLFLLLWSVGLLIPNPAGLTQPFLSGSARFLLSKGLHVVAYGLWAFLSGWVRAPGRWRWVLLGLLVAHALLTELAQRFVPTRTGSWRDVGLDCLGLALGFALSWKWWLRTPTTGGPDGRRWQ